MPGTDALLFKDDPQFWFEISRLFGSGDYGGALFGEVIAIAKRIKSGDHDSWYDANNAFADRLADEADKQIKKGHKISARDNYLRACSYYRSAEFFLHADPDDPRVKRAFERSVASYKSAAVLFTPAIEAVEIPYEGTTLPGYFHPADSSGTPRPTLVLNNGFDGSAEEMHWMGARAATAHDSLSPGGSLRTVFLGEVRHKAGSPYAFPRRRRLNKGPWSLGWLRTRSKLPIPRALFSRYCH